MSGLPSRSRLTRSGGTSKVCRGVNVAGNPPPAAFDKFRRLECLGKGGMGEVWLFEDVELHRTVALKFIAEQDFDERRRERFITEGLALARIAHPNVLTVHDVGRVQGRPYLLTEFVRGTPLNALRAPMPRADLIEAAIGLSSGLAAVHAEGILHRDVKPSNAIVPDAARGAEKPERNKLDYANVKLLDFGVAKFVGAAQHTLSTGDADAAQTGTRVIGTPVYMAPECRHGAPATVRSDLYSMGALLYDLCTGSPPALARPTRELLASDPALGRIIDRCLREDPGERFDSADLLRAALLRIDPRRRYPAQENPYRGLRPFDEEHHSVFHGRAAEVDEIIRRFHEERFTLVAGASGVGKSSL